MKRVVRIALALMAASAFLPQAMPAWAGSLKVSTTTLDVLAPAAASSLQLQNIGSEPIDVQLRVFKWTQTGNADQLTPTEAVVASPPFATIQPGREFTVRIVHTGPAGAEDSFRLLIDELPQSSASHGLDVKFAVRYSIPAFFGSRQRQPTAIAWRAEAGHGKVSLTATNKGDRRARIASLKLKRGDGIIAESNGLVGYVLGRSSMSWTLPLKSAKTTSEPALIMAETDTGPINVPITLTPAP